MEAILDFVVAQGAPLVFVVVFLDQLGLPIPTVPILLALGALAGAGRIDPVSTLLVATVASLCADFLWFRLGRWKGARVLAFLCRVALEPDTCVAKTQGSFTRYGVRSLLFAKFVPGLDTVGPALAGLVGVRTPAFLAWSAAGAFLWLGTLFGLGYAMSDSLERLAAGAERLGGWLGAAVALLFAAYLGWKWLQRHRVLRVLRLARISPEELDEMILAGRGPAIVDVRGELALDTMPVAIPGSLFITLEEIDRRHHKIPRDRDVVLYCT